MSASIYDVAKRAGVSISTVSRILNDSARVSEAKVRAVTEAIEYYNFEPNQFGRGLMKQKTQLLGVYFAGENQTVFENDYSLELLRGIDISLQSLDYSMVIINEKSGDTLHKPRFLEFVQQKRIDGLILSSSVEGSGEESGLKLLQKEHYPVLYIGKRIGAHGLNVYARYEQYMSRALKLLAERGHREILVICNSYRKPQIQRLCKTLFGEGNNAEISVFCVQKDELTMEEAVQKYFVQGTCSGAVTPGRIETMRFLRCANACRLRVPEDISLIGVEHEKDACALLETPVSCMYVPAREMGISAGKMLVRRIEEKKELDMTKEYETVYIDRGSVARGPFLGT